MTKSTNAQISVGLGVPAAEGSREPPALYCVDSSRNQPESTQIDSYVHPMFSHAPVPLYPVVLLQSVEVPVTITSPPQASSSGQVQQHDGVQKISDLGLAPNCSRYANVKPSEFSRKSHHYAAGNSSDETASPSGRKRGISWLPGVGNFQLPLLPSREASELTPFERLLQQVAGPEEVTRRDDAVGNVPQAQQLPAPSLPEVMDRPGSRGSDGCSCGQGLSLSPLSHQLQPSVVQIQSCGSNEDLHAVRVTLSDLEKVTAEVNIADEEQHSRSGAGVRVDLSRFRTGCNCLPMRDVAGRRFRKGSEDSSEYSDATKAGHVVGLRRSNNFLISESKYSLPVQDILTEVCNASTLIKSKKQEETGGQPSTAIGEPARVTVAMCSSTPHGREDPQVASEDPVTRVAALPTDASPTPVALSDHKDVNRITLKPREKIELQMMKGKLGMMLLEVDRRYEHYGEQMETLATGFNSLAGRGTAASYTGLAVQAISRRFRFLRDAVFRHLRLVKLALGEEDAQRLRGETPGLHSTTEQLQFRQRLGALQQLGMPQLLPCIRPTQRGLPEVAVAFLRAWMFEHFLHPYPKGADKCLLAEQAGLSRRQVSNWFINARVRLWKPMVEEMYMEERTSAMEAQALLYARGKSDSLQDIHQQNDGNRDDDKPLNTEGNVQPRYLVPDLNYVDEDQMRIAGPPGAVSQEGTRENEQQQFAYERGSVNTPNKRSRDVVDQEGQLVANDFYRARPAASSSELPKNEPSSHERNVTQTIEFSDSVNEQRGILNNLKNENFEGPGVCTQGVPLCSDGLASQQVEKGMHSVSHEDIRLEIVLKDLQRNISPTLVKVVSRHLNR